ncbi:MAG: molybdopterin-dependent oxidoreductase, partial [Clostridia bacterium]|nr:molybdopterin-dependent oxidoreductase [Clostridia bacterium]
MPAAGKLHRHRPDAGRQCRHRGNHRARPGQGAGTRHAGGRGTVKKRGVGVGCMWYGIGNTGAPNPAGAFLDFVEDGTVIVLTGCADIGQGSSTVLAQIAAEELGVSLEDVLVVA